MSKWRPNPLNCIYVIPDIHGMLDQLSLILKRILPLRKSDGGKDILIFLGDYIDRRQDSHLVIDKLIQLKLLYKNQIVLLRGNHEDMLLQAIDNKPTSYEYLLWMKSGGDQTLIGYLDRANDHLDNPYELMRYRVKDYIPKEHIDFFHSLQYYHEFEDWIFVHGGCDPNTDLSQQEHETFLWDRSLFQTVKFRLNNIQQLPWNKIVVTGHSGTQDVPYTRDKFMMLDTSCSGKLLVAEMRSRKAFVAKKGKARLIDISL